MMKKMATPAGRPSRARGRIYDAALRLFAENGGGVEKSDSLEDLLVSEIIPGRENVQFEPQCFWEPFSSASDKGRKFTARFE